MTTPGRFTTCFREACGSQVSQVTVVDVQSWVKLHTLHYIHLSSVIFRLAFSHKEMKGSTL